MAQNYAFKTEEPHARVYGSSLAISTKHSVEISTRLRGKKLETAKAILNDAIAMKKPIPFKRFTGDVGHKRGKGMMAGRYAVKASGAILKLLNSAEHNALSKGLNVL